MARANECVSEINAQHVIGIVSRHAPYCSPNQERIRPYRVCRQGDARGLGSRRIDTIIMLSLSWQAEYHPATKLKRVAHRAARTPTLSKPPFDTIPHRPLL